MQNIKLTEINFRIKKLTIASMSSSFVSSDFWTNISSMWFLSQAIFFNIIRCRHINNIPASFSSPLPCLRLFLNQIQATNIFYSLFISEIKSVKIMSTYPYFRIYISLSELISDQNIFHLSCLVIYLSDLKTDWIINYNHKNQHSKLKFISQYQ